MGHKIALTAIDRGQPVYKYGQIIGFAKEPILPGVIDVLGLLRPLGRIGLLAGFLCLVAAILVSPAKRSTMLAAGVGVTTVGAVLALSVLACRVLAPAVILDPAAADAVVGLSVAFFGPLRIVGLIVAVIGVAVAVAALPGDGLDPAKLRNDLWDFASRPRTRAPREFVRLTAIGAVGLIALFSPSFALSMAAVASGAIILLLAFAGWRRLIQPYMPHDLVATSEQVRVAPVAWAGARVVVLIALGIGAAALILRVRPQAEIVLASGGTCNGAAELCERPLNEVVFAGAHNGMGSATNPTWLFPNQDIGIRQSLDRGVRAFLLDPYRGNRIGDRVRTDFDAVPHANRKFEEVIGPEAWAAGMRVREQLVGDPGPSDVYLCHGFCELGALRMAGELRIFVEFLVTHPGEVVIIDFEDYTPASDIVAAFEESGLLEYVYQGPLDPNWPTLGDMVASGGRVLVITENETGGVPWMHLAWEGLMAETPYTFRTPEEFSCRENRGGPTAGLFLVNHWIETTPAPRPSNAQIVNQRDVIVERVRQCQSERGMTANIIAVDFAGIGDVVGAVRELNGLTPLTALLP